MRVLRWVWFLILSATLGVAQSSPQSADVGQQTAPGQQPQNPLQEPAKPSEAEANKPKAPTFEAGQAATAGENQDVGEIRLMTRYTEIGGDQTRSFRVQGLNNLAEFNYFMDHRFVVTRRIQVLSMYRGTDDSSIDPERNSLQKAYVRIFGPRDEYIFGDALVNFSRLTFNQNIKGLTFTEKLGEDWKFSGVSGVFIDRYGSLFKEFNALPGRPYMAVVNGGRLEFTPMRDSAVGFNFSTSTDRVGTVRHTAFFDPQLQQWLPAPPGMPDTASQPTDNKVASMDAKFQFPVGLRFESEFAYSVTNFDRRCAAPCGAPGDSQRGFGDLEDWGARAEASWRHKKLNLRGSYVRYEPNFASLNARQIADLQDFLGRASYDLTGWLTVDGTVRRSNDNLRQQRDFQRTLWGPEARFILHDLPFSPHSTLELGYRHRTVQGSDSIKRCVVPPPIMVNPATTECPDQFVRIPFAEINLPYRSTFFTLGYERRQAQDNIHPAQTSNTNRVYVGLRGVYDLGGWHINPTLRFELERQGHRPGLEFMPIVDPTLAYDSNRLASAAFFVEAPKWFIFEAAYRDSSATTLGTDSVTLLHFPSGYSRPSYKAQVTYKIANDENHLFILGFERNNNFYFLPQKPYDERVWSATIVYRFGKRAQ